MKHYVLLLGRQGFKLYQVGIFRDMVHPLLELQQGTRKNIEEWLSKVIYWW